jgi:hypothetical protein
VEGSSREVRFVAPATLVEQSPNQPAADFVRFTRARPTARELVAYAGAYYSDELDVRWTVAADSSGLVARIPGGDTLRLAPTIRDVFVGGGVVMRFRRTGARGVGALLQAGRVRNIAFTFASQSRTSNPSPTAVTIASSVLATEAPTSRAMITAA